MGHQLAVGGVSGDIKEMRERVSRPAKGGMGCHVAHQLAVEIDAPSVVMDGIEELRPRAHGRGFGGGGFATGLGCGHSGRSDKDASTEVNSASKLMSRRP